MDEHRAPGITPRMIPAPRAAHVDVASRRRTDRLRREFGLTAVTPAVGVMLRQHAQHIRERVTDLLPALVSRYELLPPAGQRRWQEAVSGVVEEFVSLVEDRPSGGRRPVDHAFVALGQTEARGGGHPAAALCVLQSIHSAFAVCWSRGELSTAQGKQLDRALSLLVRRLHQCAWLGYQQVDRIGAADDLPENSERVRITHALVEHGLAMHPVPMRLVASSPTHDEATPEPGGTSAQAPHRVDASRLLLVGTDHRVMLTSEPPRRSPRTGPPSYGSSPGYVVCTGPLPYTDLPRAYDTALLLLRLMQVGVASPRSPVPCPEAAPNFLLPSPEVAHVRLIARLLRPLTERSLHTRLDLTRTLLLQLGTGGRTDDMAHLLRVHPQTVRKRLRKLSKLYPIRPTTHRDTLTVLAALHYLIPLWEQELAERQGRSPGSSEGPR